MSVENLSCSSEPKRAVPARINPLLADETGGDLQHQALDRERAG
jgi:hypothetical protein